MARDTTGKRLGKSLTLILGICAFAPPAFSEPITWDGAYAGGQLSLDMGEVDWRDNNGGWFTFAPGTTHSAKDTGGGVGAFIGKNWQFSNKLIAGVELSATSLSNSKSVTSPLFPASDTWTTEVNWQTSLTGRLGYPVGKWLPYFEGGVAVSEVSMTNSDVATIFGVIDCGSETCFFDSRELHTGYVAGVGFDYRVSENIVIGLNYRYADLGSKTHSGTTTPTGTPENFTVDAETHVLALRVSVMLN